MAATYLIKILENLNSAFILIYLLWSKTWRSLLYYKCHVTSMEIDLMWVVDYDLLPELDSVGVIQSCNTGSCSVGIKKRAGANPIQPLRSAGCITTSEQLFFLDVKNITQRLKRRRLFTDLFCIWNKKINKAAKSKFGFKTPNLNKVNVII